MSFRNRLTLFFVVIVIVPLIAVALVLFRLVSVSEVGRLEARLDQARRTGQGEYRTALVRGRAVGRRIGSDPALAGAIAGRDRVRVRARLSALAREESAVRVRADLDGLGAYDVGVAPGPRGPAFAPAPSRLVDGAGRSVGRLQVSMISAQAFGTLVETVTRLRVVVDAGERILYASEPIRRQVRGPAQLDGDEVTLGRTVHRITTLPTTGFDGGTGRLRILGRRTAEDSAFSGARIVAGGVLLGFLALAFAFALTVSRSLGHQVQRLLEAARGVGRGDYRIRVPTEGNDEFAELGSEFNAMARQLELRLEELQTERTRLQGAIRRVGDSFAKGLDRDALLGLLVETAVDGVGADCGRATVHEQTEGDGIEVARAGDLATCRHAIRAVERTALETRALAESSEGEVKAIALPLLAADGDRVLSLISVARDGRPFTEPDKELFTYLANQAAVSVENVDLHQTVQHQAVTDDLTGLFNHRRFQEVMGLEIERTRRFGSGLGLIMLDLDDFKRVNDTYGHMQGDMVLREVAAVLRESAREVDEPARYGGEEMAVALPHTDLEGAYRFAERVRRRIEALELPVLGGDGSFHVTASFGVAAIGEGGLDLDTDKEGLVAAADAAMYRAKRSGKNRTAKAE